MLAAIDYETLDNDRLTVCGPDIGITALRKLKKARNRNGYIIPSASAGNAVEQAKH